MTLRDTATLQSAAAPARSGPASQECQTSRVKICTSQPVQINSEFAVTWVKALAGRGWRSARTSVLGNKPGQGCR